MGLIDKETFLPGVITEVESDYSYGYDSSLFGTTESAVIIGTAFNGPSGQPIQVFSPEHARYLFGQTFDSKTKREASLVAGIEDAYKRGCRTIYGVRVGGKDLRKQFDFNIETEYRLDIRAAYPTNQAKDFFIVYDDTEGAETIKIYKPAERATVVEKMQGAVESDNSIIIIELKVNHDYGLTKDSNIIDVISIVNNHPYNNVLRLGIVDREGIDVMNTSVQAKSMPFGAMYPGAYFIGRDQNVIETDTELNFKLMSKSLNSVLPYSTFEGSVYKELVFNSDLNNGLPIYSKRKERLAEILKDHSIYSTKLFDFLEIPGIVDTVFGKDNEDYEEVDMSTFDIYQKLGSGYAITAKAEPRHKDGVEITPRIKETPASDINRIAELKDGIFSMLENLNAKYRSVVGVYADQKISSKLPRPSDFKEAQPLEADIFEGLIRVKPIVKDKTIVTPKRYTFTFKKVDENAPLGKIDEIYSESVLPSYSKDDGSSYNLPNGTVIARETTSGSGFELIYISSGKETVKTNAGVDFLDKKAIVLEEEVYFLENGYFKKATSVNLPMNKKYVLMESNANVYIMEVDGYKLNPLGEVETMLGENEEETIIFAQSNFFEKNNIVIQSSAYDTNTLEEFVELLNSNKVLKSLFKFEVSPEGLIYKDDYIVDIVKDGLSIADQLDISLENGDIEDRKIGWNYNKYIPYKTADNFARQLAQHCTYTSLKTAPAHGIIGVAPLDNTTLSGIANHVEQLLEKEFDLYAKTPQGKNMLDRNNMPYPLGKSLSITAMQYNVVLDSGYVYRSNGSGGYGGMVSVLSLDQSSTNQPYNVSEVAFDYTNHQLNRLVQKGYVTLKNSFTKGFVVTDGITFAPAESPFRRLNVSRIASAIEELIREAAEPYIGKQNNDANRNSMQTAIRSRLDKLKGTLIEAYEFNMVLDPRIAKFAYIDIDYNIVPIYEIREVRNRVKVKDQL